MTQLFQTKVCGITSVEDAQMCVAAGVDAIGLNFYDPSPRSISDELALEIAESVRGHIELVGLFVNEAPERIRKLHDAVRFDYLQLHGDEDPFYLKHLSSLPIIKAFRCRNTDPSEVLDYLAACTTFDITLQAILLDAFDPDNYGGTGHRLDWNNLNLKDSSFGGCRVILAGGITGENVHNAICRTKTQAVDTASGVECESGRPGQKDLTKVHQFVEQARLAFG